MTTLTLVLLLLLLCYAVSRSDAATTLHKVGVRGASGVARGAGGDATRREARSPAAHSPRFLVAQALNRGLAGSPMASTGFALEAAGWRWKVSPFFIAGIAATESSLGAAACSNNRFNAFGLSSCGGGWAVPAFRSWGEAYQFMGRFLKARWPRATSTYDYRGYAADSRAWGASTARHMADLFGVENETRYGATGRVL